MATLESSEAEAQQEAGVETGPAIDAVGAPARVLAPAAPPRRRGRSKRLGHERPPLSLVPAAQPAPPPLTFRVAAEGLLTRGQTAVHWLLGMVWAAGCASSWWWWATAAGQRAGLLHWLETGALAVATTLPPAAVWRSGMRARRPHRHRARAEAKVALLTVCDSTCHPIETIGAQLGAIASVRYPHTSWVLDQSSSVELRRLADALGVSYLARGGVKRWNRERPPFERGTRAGIVNAWLDHVGNLGLDYDVFVELDLDQHPRADYVERVLGYLEDPVVAWVQAPSLYPAVGRRGRGRRLTDCDLLLPALSGRELVGGTLRPGAATIYRTRAVQAVGGLGADADRRFAAAGYQGVMVPEALVTDSGPQGLIAFLRAQLRRDRAMSPQPPVNARGRVAKAAGSLAAVAWLLAALVAPAVAVTALVTHRSLASASLLDGALRLAPLGLGGLLIWLWTLSRLQPKGSRLSWRSVVLHLIRTPFAWWAVVRAVVARSLHAVQPFLVPINRGRHRIGVLVASGLWAGALAFLVVWWVQPRLWPSTVGIVVYSVAVGFELMGQFLWVLLTQRMRRPNPARALPELRAAMVVTKAPSEPWPLVRKTLQAMLRQDYPHPYDVWLADEDPTPQVRRWCERRGVLVSTRRGVEAYHQPRWPRRTRCKEGNLAYFYDTHGYERYDVVSQLDADHVPEPGYLRNVVAPFADPEVGYVSAPSICDANADRSWSARGRLFAESVLHGPAQSGCSYDYAPSCIGSHYTVRTAALESIGGLGPELAEDFSTTIMFNAAGWRGVFAIDAIAHGAGPECVADCVTQDFQWARSITWIMLRVTPRHWRGLTARAKLKLGWCQLWYPLNGVVCLTWVVIPVIALLTGHPLIRVSVGAFYLHVFPAAIAVYLGIVWFRSRGLLRPVRGRPLSWEAILFVFVRWPWAFAGSLQGFAGAISNREFDFKVTPKGSRSARRLPGIVLFPYLALAALSLLPALLVADPGQARGYYFWSLLNGAIYIAVALAIALLHAREHRGVGARSLPALGWVAVAGMVGVLGLAGTLRGKEAMRTLTTSPEAPNAALAASPVPAAYDPSAQVALGVTTIALTDGWNRRWAPAQLEQVNGFEHQIGKHVQVVMTFADWAHSHFDAAEMSAIAARGSVPEITWEPWDASKGTYAGANEPDYSLSTIIDGRHDALIWSWARAIKAYGRPVLLRFAQEMNLKAYPWSESANGNRRGQYVEAWRHVHHIFSLAGASNALWLWSPVAGPFQASDYPGDGYVDVVGLSGFNGGTDQHWGGWRSFEKIYGGRLTVLHELAPSKPVQITEIGTTEDGGDKAQWYRDMFRYLRYFPYVTSVVTFDVSKEADWRVDSSASALRAFRTGAGEPRFGQISLTRLAGRQ